ncbi:MAG TPA: hypothetical protein VFX53_13885 [Pedococcus sp.]|nr:hypothetical protein [Pedococcus sp.]
MGRSGGRISGYWHLVPLTFLAVSLVMLGLAANGLWASYAQDPAPVAPGDRVTVSSSGLSLLRDEGETALAVCELRSDGLVVPLEELAGGHVRLSTGGFQEVAATAGRVPAGTYTLACASGGQGLYAARRLVFGDAGVVGALGLVPLALALGVGTLVVVGRARAPRTPAPPLSPFTASMRS